MVVLGGRTETTQEARALCKKMVEQGHALERFGRMIEAQGGDRRVIDNLALLPARGGASTSPRRRAVS